MAREKNSSRPRTDAFVLHRSYRGADNFCHARCHYPCAVMEATQDYTSKGIRNGYITHHHTFTIVVRWWWRIVLGIGRWMGYRPYWIDCRYPRGRLPAQWPAPPPLNLDAVRPRRG